MSGDTIAAPGTGGQVHGPDPLAPAAEQPAPTVSNEQAWPKSDPQHPQWKRRAFYLKRGAEVSGAAFVALVVDLIVDGGSAHHTAAMMVSAGTFFLCTGAYSAVALLRSIFVK